MINPMNKILLALALAGGQVKGSTIIDYPSAPISIAGWSQNYTISAGADIAISSWGWPQQEYSIDISAYDTTLNINGGIVRGNIEINGYNTILNVSGGTIAEVIEVWGWNSLITFYGNNLELSENRIHGFLQDGNKIDTLILGAWIGNGQGPWGNIVQIVPEPSTYALFGLGAIAMIVTYRRRVA
jgi:hypothetical protein